MKSKGITVPFLLPSTAGPILCEDGEIESAGFPLVPTGGVVKVSGVLPDKEKEWQEDVAVDSGFRVDLPPFPCVTFSLARDIVPGWHNHPGNLPSKEVSAPKEKTQSGWGEKAAELLRLFQKDAGKANLFIHPFFAIASWRTAGGHHIMPSPPVLMIPNSLIPAVSGEMDYSTDTMKMSVVGAACRLRQRISAIGKLKNWDGRITHLDIFVSAPLVKFGPKDGMTGFHRKEHTAFSLSVDMDGKEVEHRISDTLHPQLWESSEAHELELAKVCQELIFKKVSSIPFVQLNEGNGFEDTTFDFGSIGDFELLESYTPDYASCRGVNAGYSKEISGRMTLCSLTMELPGMPAPVSLFQNHGNGLDSGKVACIVECEKKGNRIVCEGFMKDWPGMWMDMDSFPRWLFYPDPDARRLSFITSSGTYSVSLQPHPALHGAVWWGGMAGTRKGVAFSPASLTSEPQETDIRGSWKEPAGMCRSEKGSDVYFPGCLYSVLDTGRVIALCRAFRSSGLVAVTAPTVYAFTETGIYLFRESEDGILKDAGLISGEVLRSLSDLRINSGWIDFADVKGEWHRINGTKVECLSTCTDSGGVAGGGRRIVISGGSDGDEVWLSMRPMKLGDPFRAKRIKGIGMAGRYDGECLRIKLWGSDDLRRWGLIGEFPVSKGGGLRTPFRRYFKVEVAGRLNVGEVLEGVVFRM